MAKAASKTQSANLQVVEPVQEQEQEMKVTTLPSTMPLPQSEKELKEKQRSLRIEQKNIKDALKAAKEAKDNSLSPKEKAQKSIRKQLVKANSLTKKGSFAEARAIVVKLAKELEAAAAIE